MNVKLKYEFNSIIFQLFAHIIYSGYMNNIKKLRKDKGLTQRQLADLIGIEQTGVCKWEKGICLPSSETLVKLAEIFEVSTDFVLGITRYHFPVNVGRDNVFTFEEFKIIEQYRSLPENLKQTVKDSLNTFVSFTKYGGCFILLRGV